jgi:tetratricopeptide (TPR) repeat protein
VDITNPFVWVIGALFATAAVIAFLRTDGPRPVMEPETAGQRRLAAKSAYSKSLSRALPDPELKAYFSRLGRAIRTDDSATIRLLADTELLYGLLREHKLLPKKLLRNRKVVLKEFAKIIGSTFSGVMAWTSLEIRDVSYSRNREEAIVYTRARKADHSTAKIRWWLSRREGVWRFYDMQDLHSGLRYSTGLGVGLLSAAGEKGGTNLTVFGDVMNAVTEERFADADADLKDLENAQLPKAFDATRWWLAATVHANNGRYAKALAASEKALARDEFPSIHALRLWIYRALGQPKEALAAGEKYIEWLGDEPLICAQMALVHAERHDDKKAESYYRRGLADDPQSRDCLLGLAAILPDNAKPKLVPFFLANTTPAETFEWLSVKLADADDAPALGTLIEAFRKKHPDSPLLREAEQLLEKIWNRLKDTAPKKPIV